MAGQAAIIVALGAVLVAPGLARAQFAAPEAAKPSGAELFKRQCAACHSVVAGEPARQGPSLVGVVGRQAGTVPGFKYSAGFAKADWVWDDARLNTWLENPQAMIPGAIMPYRQAKADVRAALISYLNEIH